jgi:selT/selW/selH-like putative selenoprotein
MEKKLKVKPTLIESSGGVFEIEVNKKLVYSKKATGEFPDNEKLIAQIKKQFAA